MVLGWEPVPQEMIPAIRGGFPGTELNGRRWSDYFHEVTPDGKVAWEWHAYEALDVELGHQHALTLLGKDLSWHSPTACSDSEREGRGRSQSRRSPPARSLSFGTLAFGWSRSSWVKG